MAVQRKVFKVVDDSKEKKLAQNFFSQNVSNTNVEKVFCLRNQHRGCYRSLHYISRLSDVICSETTELFHFDCITWFWSDYWHRKIENYLLFHCVIGRIGWGSWINLFQLPTICSFNCLLWVANTWRWPSISSKQWTIDVNIINQGRHKMSTSTAHSDGFWMIFFL